MAMSWAKKFYESRAWQITRDSAMIDEHYICRKCNGINGPAEIVHHITWLNNKNINDPNITLNKANLMPVCRICHALIHEGVSSTVEGLRFNKEGELINEDKSIYK